MRNLKIRQDHLRAALRMEERNLKDLLDDIELNDAAPETVGHRLRRIEESLKRARRLVPARKNSSWDWTPAFNFEAFGRAA